MNLKLVCSALFLLGYTYSTFAGGVGNTIETSHDFNGLYFGVESGLETDYVNLKTVTSQPNQPIISSSSSSTAGGVHFIGAVGYGKMFTEKMYFGLKGVVRYSPTKESTSGTDLSYKNLGPAQIQDAVTTNISASASPGYNLSLLWGYEIVHHVLPFVQGGITFNNNKYQVNTNVVQTVYGDPLNSFDLSEQLNLSGYRTTFNVGAGLYVILHKNLLVSAEMSYIGNTRVSGVTNIDYSKITFTNSLVSMSASLNYLFPV